MTRTVRATAFVLAGVLSPMVLAAQQPAPPQEAQALIVELQQVQARLQPVQQQALQDSALQAEQAAVSASVREAIVTADPEMAGKLDRMEALMREAREAQAAGDADKIVALTQEAQGLEPEVRAAQAQAMARPEIEQQIEQFQGNLSRRMIEIDPETEPLIARRNELNAQLRALMDGN